MKTKPKPHSRHVVIKIVGIVLAFVLLASGIAAFMNQPSPIKSGRRQFYIMSGGVGGKCKYYLADRKGKTQDVCVDKNLIADTFARIDLLEPVSESQLDVDVYPVPDINALWVDADIRVVTEQRSALLPKPEYKKTPVIYIDTIHNQTDAALPE